MFSLRLCVKSLLGLNINRRLLKKVDLYKFLEKNNLTQRHGRNALRPYGNDPIYSQTLCALRLCGSNLLPRLEGYF
jgi:hypothetical protein